MFIYLRFCCWNTNQTQAKLQEHDMYNFQAKNSYPEFSILPSTNSHCKQDSPKKFFYYISDISLTYDEPIFCWIAESVTQAIVQSDIQLIDPKVHNKKQKLVGAISVIKRSRWHSGRTAQ